MTPLFERSNQVMTWNERSHVGTQLRAAIMVALALVLAGCTAGTQAQNPPSPTSVPTEMATPVAVGAALTWEGQIENGEGAEAQCSRLELDESKSARVGDCGSAGQTRQLFSNRDQEWAQIQARFASFEYRSATDHLTFRGTGTVAGAAWQRAILSWVHTTFGELSSGRVSAAVRTKMSWMLDPLPGQTNLCAHLAIMSSGYAFADVAPCQGGGTMEDTQSGWLETAEWEQFDAWEYSRASYSKEMNYFEGQGTQTLSEAEVQAMDAWARNVYNRLKPPAAAGQAAAPTGLSEVKVDHVEVQVGVGSPIPVTILMDGNFPDTCAQIANLHQQQEGNQFMLTLTTSSPGGEGCINDTLPFRAAIPLNIVGLKAGTYTVAVNGVSADFKMPIHPAETN
jgi:hypothetical protein